METTLHWLIPVGVEPGGRFRLAINADRDISVPTSLQALTLLLPQLADGEGYQIRYVNTTDVREVFAESQPFEIAQGAGGLNDGPNTEDWLTRPSALLPSPASSSTASSTASSTVAIPGPYTVSEAIPCRF
jgi:hypothetical protein